MAKEIEYWAVIFDKDGSEITHSAFTSQHEAQTWVNAQDNHACYRVQPSRLRLYESAFELQPTLNKAARISGMNKLTVEERNALGLGGLIVR